MSVWRSYMLVLPFTAHAHPSRCRRRISAILSAFSTEVVKTIVGRVPASRMVASATPSRTFSARMTASNCPWFRSPATVFTWDKSRPVISTRVHRTSHRYPSRIASSISYV